MRIHSMGVLLFASVLCAACATQHKLKTPCALPASAMSYGDDDCGPLLPVNEALSNAVQPEP